jgi:PAS domain S-box-containing protein
LFLNQTTSAGDATHASDRRGLTRNSSHSVHFYEDDSLFLDSLGEFMGAALGAGSACVVIATEPHHNGLAHRLTALGLDLGLAADTNRYIALDAAELLTCFMVDGWPDEARFVQTIEPQLRQARSGSRKLTTPVVAFGEMVSVLCMHGLPQAALRLEQLWNELAKRHALSLRCAYPMQLFSGAGGGDVFHRICAEHNAVIPAESYLNPEGASFPAGAELHLHSTPLHFALELRQKEIEQRREVEDRLRATEEFAWAIAESSVDWITVLSLDGRVQYINPQGAEALAIDDANKVLGQKWTDIWDEADRARAQSELAAAATGQVGSFQAECSSRLGQRRCWDVKITPARGIDGQVEQLIAVSRDITELRLAQTAAIHAEKLATAGRMAASIAHEINNPLEAVTNFIFLAQTSPGVPESVLRHLELADRELTRVAHIARQTLGFYRSTSASRWMPVAELVRDALMIYERRLRNKELSVEVAIDPELKVYGKDGELRQALLNLTANAIDACHSGGRIWIRAQRNRNWTNGAEQGIRFTLADNGTGMAPDVKSRVFAPFFTTKADVGTGIGLWVTKCLVEQRGGYVRFRSRQGDPSGTVMSFFLPEAHLRESEVQPQETDVAP